MLTGSTDDLMPTEDSVRQIANDQSLLAGFDDPEVMRAVQDVAQNPANIQKYKNNKKVIALIAESHANQASQATEQKSLIAYPSWPLLVSV